MRWFALGLRRAKSSDSLVTWGGDATWPGLAGACREVRKGEELSPAGHSLDRVDRAHNLLFVPVVGLNASLSNLNRDGHFIGLNNFSRPSGSRRRAAA